MKKFKLVPYQLTEIEITDNVETGKRIFVGEIISYPIPNPTGDTIMVRRVPGHPGTLIEVPVSSLRAPRQTYRWVHYAIVKGHGAFATDMLRYDSCEPVNFTIEERFGRAVLADGTGPDLIVADVSSSARPTWTVDRWRSFMWFIRPLKSERIGETVHA